MITEDYVSFEVAKLLKEKGFDGDINFWYNENGNEIFFQQKYDLMYNWRVRQGLEIYQCPTLQMAMKWLREVHNIAICTHAYYPAEPYELSHRNNKPYWKIRIMNPVYSRDYDSFNTYEEACEAAIKYCLEKLI